MPALTAPSFFHWTSIVLSSLLLEDPTTLYVSALVGEKPMLWVYGVSAIIFGLVIGDSGLYALGRFAQTFRPRSESARSFFHRELRLLVFGARFVPGLRVAVYGYAGFRKMPFLTFLALNFVSSILWTVLLVFFGRAIYSHLGWSGLAAIALVILAMGFYRRRSFTDKKTPPDGATPKVP